MGIAKVQLSGSTNGRNIEVAATGTPGTTIHTAPASPSFDEIFLWAVNSSASPVKLTLEWGGVTVADDLIEQTIQPEDGLVLVVPGLTLGNALVVRAFAGSASTININGWGLRHT